MFKTFGIGVILGLIVAGAAARFLPFVDLHREASIISVLPNGGNVELFEIHLPTDRIMAGQRDMPGRTPAGLVWPDATLLAGVGVELFKIRNSQKRVVGVASRITAPTAQTPAEWTLYLPARGAMYVPMGISSNGGRAGNLRAGTREFAKRSGIVSERFVADAGGDAPDGRIELRAILVSTETVETGGAGL